MATTTASHILAALIDSRITNNYLVVVTSDVSPTDEQLDAAYVEMQRVMAEYAALRYKNAMQALNRAYALLDSKNPLDDIQSFHQGKHPVLVSRYGRL